jgi:hypothetical protein
VTVGVGVDWVAGVGVLDLGLDLITGFGGAAVRVGPVAGWCVEPTTGLAAA